MYNFAYSYTFSEFLHTYVLDHLIMYPIVIIAITLGFVILVRVSGDNFIKKNFIKTEYYSRRQYGALNTITNTGVGTVFGLIIIGITFNAVLSTQMNNTVDTLFNVVNQTSDNIGYVYDGLVAIKNNINNGGNIINTPITEELAASQKAISSQIDDIQRQLNNFSASLNAFEQQTVATSANLSTEARAILLSLLGYEQLTGVPPLSEIPEVNATDINSQFSEAYTDINSTIDQLNEVRDNVNSVDPNDIDVKGSTGGIDSTLASLETLNASVLKFYEKKEMVDDKTQYYDTIRVAIIIVTYLIPLVAVIAGLLAVQFRTTQVVRAWYHVLLFAAAWCGIFAGLYFSLSIILNDVCHDFDTALFVGIRSAEPDYEQETWYANLTTYYPVVTRCNDTSNMLGLLNIPQDFNDIINGSNDIAGKLTGGNYTALMKDANSKLDSGVEAVYDVNYTVLLNGTKTKDELVGVRAQLADLSKFGYKEAEQQSTLSDINEMTEHIEAHYPDGSTVIYSLFYVNANISLLKLDRTPYVYTTQSYRSQLNESLTQYYVLDATRDDAVALTDAINNNITLLMSYIDGLTNETNKLSDLQAQTNITADSLRQSTSKLDDSLDDLMNNIIPGLFNNSQIWDMVVNATKCKYITDAYKDAKHFVCTDFVAATAAFVSTHLVAAAIILVVNLAASFAWFAFRYPYKPYHLVPKDDLNDSLVYSYSWPVESATKGKYVSLL